MSNIRIQLYPGAGEETLVFDGNIARYDTDGNRLIFVLTSGRTVDTTLPHLIATTPEKTEKLDDGDWNEDRKRGDW